MSAVLLAAVTLTNVPGCVNAGAVKSTEPVYPKMAQYPGEDENGWDKWNSSRRKQLSAPEGYCDSLWSFYGDSSRTYLSGTQENRAYSPVSLYMALSMLAECTLRREPQPDTQPDERPGYRNPPHPGGAGLERKLLRRRRDKERPSELSVAL